jgi:succinate dehydrogenase / fumarate reductase membrane anchor subunit
MREQVITREVIADPKTRYGNSKASTRHFITQRVTGAINLLFVGLMVFLVIRLAGAGRAEMVATIGNAWIGIPLAILLVIVTVHMRNGLRETLEDYFDGRMYRLLMLLNTIFAIAVAILGVGSILKLVFWG